MEQDIEIKTCTKCKKEHPITHFQKCKEYADGIQRFCKDCSKVYRAVQNENDKQYQEKKRKREELEKLEIEHQSKHCTECGEFKPFTEYYVNPQGKYKRFSICILCRNKKDGIIRAEISAKKQALKPIPTPEEIAEKLRIKKEKRKERHLRKKVEYAITQTNWRLKNKDKINQNVRDKKAKNPEKAKADQSRYYQKSKPRANAWQKKQRETNPQYNIIRKQRNRFYGILKKSGVEKKNSTLEFLGCTKEFLQEYITKQFTKNMTWEKCLKGGEIEIDHIIPCSKFDMTKIEDQRQCWHYTNLRPMWKSDNRKKNGKLIPELAQLKLTL